MTMALRKLEQWLEKYWLGELSQVEEMQFKSELKANKDSLKGELRQMADWFESHEESKQNLVLEDDFDKDIMKKIHQKSQPKEVWNWMKVAASILVVFALGFFAWWVPQQQEQKQLAQQEEKAYKEAKATLELMASMMNHGRKHLSSLEMINTAQEKVKNTFQPDKKEKKEGQDG
jgi:high-affinity Fe2+/Pb2+ permease